MLATAETHALTMVLLEAGDIYALADLMDDVGVEGLGLEPLVAADGSARWERPAGLCAYPDRAAAFAALESAIRKWAGRDGK